MHRMCYKKVIDASLSNQLIHLRLHQYFLHHLLQMHLH